MFLGWYDPDRKKPARAKLAEAIERYEEKFGRTARLLPDQPAGRRRSGRAVAQVPGRTAGVVQARGYIARWTFYIGEEAGEPPRADAGRGDRCLNAGRREVC